MSVRVRTPVVRLLPAFLAAAAIGAHVGCGQPQPGDDSTPAGSREAPPGPLPNARPLTDATFEPTPARLARGRYLAESVTMCIHCHSPPDTTRPGRPALGGMEGAGRVVFEDDTRRIVAPNLTPDPETGTGTWPDDALARAIREGVGHDGRALSLPMYWGAFRDLSDEDLASIVVYLRSLPPVRNPLPSRSLPPERVAELAEDPEPLTRAVPGPDLSDPIERGKYLIRIADCVGCHTAWYSDPRPGEFGGGNRIGNDDVYSTNITHDESGIGSWDARTFIQVIRTGKAGTLDPAMPWVVFARMTDEDLAAVYEALGTAPAVRHWIDNTAPPTYCEVCGQEHGLGELNERVPIVPAEVPADVLAGYAGRYVAEDGEVLEVTSGEGGLTVGFENGASLELIPLSATTFRSLRMPSPFEFEFDETGAVAGLRIRQGLDEDAFARVR